MAQVGSTRPPEGLSAAEKRMFLAVRQQLRDQGTWQESDAGCLTRYVRAIVRAERAQEIVAEKGPIAEGGRGQPVVHPAVLVARAAERDAAEYARDLLLTPRSRRLAGISDTTSVDDELAGLLS